MPNEDAIALAEPDYKSEYKRLVDENRWLKEEVDRMIFVAREKGGQNNRWMR